MKKYVQPAVVALLVLGLLTAVVSCEVAVWKDCRQTNGWMFCMRALSK